MRQDQVPTVQGHRLEVLIDGFEVVVASNFYGRNSLKGKEGEELLEDLRKAAHHARDIDFAIRKSKLVAAPDSIEENIHKLEQVSGRFHGLAGILRSIGPFKAKKPKK